MTIELPDDILRFAFETLARHPGLKELIKAEIMERARELAAENDLLSPAAAAEMLGVTTRTLHDNHVAWGLDKSVNYGAQKPFYFRNQILARAREKCVKGRRRESHRLTQIFTDSEVSGGAPSQESASVFHPCSSVAKNKSAAA